MRKKVLVLTLVIVMVLSCAVLFTACDKGGTQRPIDIEDGSRPDYDSLFTADDVALINAAMADGASEEVKKQAVMTLYNVANKSRKETPLSLMVQNSDVGIPSYLGNVIMHAFNLRQGDSWYYQLATDAESYIADILKGFAGILKVAYTSGDGVYNYVLINGSETEMDCSLETFPYASFKLTSKPQPYDYETFKEELHFLDSMHEINNMAFCAEIIADGAEIEYDSEEGFYTVKFSIDKFADQDLIKEWYAMPQKDMQVSGNTIYGYNSYEATLQVWDNGYAKYFISYADREASGMASGKPMDEFKYFWVEEEIMALLEQDKSVVVDEDTELTSPADYINYYSGKEIVKGKLLSDLYIALIVIACVIVVVIIVVVVIEILVRKGKLPKLAAKREMRKSKRLLKRAEKLAAKNGGAVESADGGNMDECVLNESGAESSDEEDNA
ncbi:MAG: hypothetical protein K2G31_04125 [Clostridia bacterium]|nr:hypothetical protein [Clostridia bacterium]